MAITINTKEQPILWSNLRFSSNMFSLIRTCLIICILSLPSSKQLVLGKQCHFSKSQFPHLLNMILMITWKCIHRAQSTYRKGIRNPINATSVLSSKEKNTWNVYYVNPQPSFKPCNSPPVFFQLSITLPILFYPDPPLPTRC